MSELELKIRDGQTHFTPGETVTVDLEWDLPKRPQRLELCLLWHTEGKGDEDGEVEVRESIDINEARGQRSIDVHVPRRPYSFVGKLISLRWYLELSAWPSKESTLVEVSIAPGEGPVRLRNQGK